MQARSGPIAAMGTPVGVAGLSAGAIALLAGYCQTHGWLVDGTPLPLDLSVTWGVKATAGWVVAWLVLRWLCARMPASARGAPWLSIALLVPTFLLLAEWLLGSVAERLGALPESAGLAWLAYERAPLLAATAVALAWLARSGRLPRLLLDRAAEPNASALLAEPDASALLEVATGTGRTHVRLLDVEQFESCENYARVHVRQGRTFLLRRTMESLERDLSGTPFVRVHRRTIVNTACIVERRPGSMLLLASGATVRVSRSYRAKLPPPP
jgi:hypothetical protein